MELQTANSNTVNEFTRCQHHTRKGRCTLLVSDPASAFCSDHSRPLRKASAQAAVASRLIGETGEFRSAVEINRSLGELYKLLARDEIAPRRAAVMAFTASLLLRTLPAIEHETQSEQQFLFDVPRPKLNDEPRIIIDMPGPDRD